ncbi:MAG: F0F1 ATP synthase subunit delta [Acidobacteria bacterium]|nr:F0F1 ATP synthase subunit delta [Acidobacteriota bacterium]
MGAATRTSTAAGVAALARITRPVERLGDELLTAARGLASSHQLLSVLADVGIPAEQRVALAQRVFAGLSAQTRDLLATLASGRWSEPVDLVAGVEELGFRALAASPSGEGLDSELFSVLQTVGSEGRLELALGGMSSPVEARLALVDTLLQEASPATRLILRHIVQLPRGRKPLEALRDVQAIVADARDRVVAVVQTAAPLSAAQAKALAARLEQGYGRKISINQVVDPSLLGGVRITIGDDVIDGTVRARLDDLRLRLAG